MKNNCTIPVEHIIHRLYMYVFTHIFFYTYFSVFSHVYNFHMFLYKDSVQFSYFISYVILYHIMPIARNAFISLYDSVPGEHLNLILSECKDLLKLPSKCYYSLCPLSILQSNRMFVCPSVTYLLWNSWTNLTFFLLAQYWFGDGF